MKCYKILYLPLNKCVKIYLGVVMRVISGKYKGKNLMGFDIEGTRPTMDRVKESVFAIIQNKIKNSVCLDLFAGSGSLGIEAISNGASYCYFVENSNKIFNILRDNLTGIDNAVLLKKDYNDALKYFFNNNIKFDIVFLDPPYKFNLINDILIYIYKNNLLNDDGYIVCEFEEENVFSDKFSLIKSKKYGNKNVFIYKKLKI